MSKKTIYVILIVLAGLLIVGGAIWYLFFGPTEEAVPPPGAGFTVPGATTSHKLKTISERPII